MTSERKIVEVKMTFRNKVRRKAEAYGKKQIIYQNTKVNRAGVRRVIDSGRVTRANLDKLVKFFEGDDANVDDYIKPEKI